MPADGNPATQPSTLQQYNTTTPVSQGKQEFEGLIIAMEKQDQGPALRGAADIPRPGYPPKARSLARFRDLPYLIWLFTESNFPTFVIPNTAFGVLGALAGPCLSTQEKPSIEGTLLRLPLVALFNWANVYIFDLANQRLPESVQEDIVNKPWRPIPTGRITSEQTRRLMLYSIPTVLGLSFLMGVWRESALILLLTWLYNDLKGGDELVRDLIIAVAFGLYNSASLIIAMGSGAEITPHGYTWIAIISGVILTTMQIQDLKDQAGDRGRGRKTIPLFFGDVVSRWSIAIFVTAWSGCCVFFWGLPSWAYALPAAQVVTLGVYIAFHVLMRRAVKDDDRVWRLWCLWLITLYLLPVALRFQAILQPGRVN